MSVQCSPPNNQQSFPTTNSVISPTNKHGQHSQQYNNNQVIYSQPQNNIEADYQHPAVENGRPMTFLEREILEVTRREREYKVQQQQLGHMTLKVSDIYYLNSILSRTRSKCGGVETNGIL